MKNTTSATICVACLHFDCTGPVLHRDMWCLGFTPGFHRAHTGVSLDFPPLLHRSYTRLRVTGFDEEVAQEENEQHPLPCNLFGCKVWGVRSTHSVKGYGVGFYSSGLHGTEFTHSEGFTLD